MNSPQPGWFPDPYGRHNRRYFDGRSWTAHVADAQGNQGSDPEPLAPAAPSTAGSQGAWANPPTQSYTPQAAQPLRSAPQSYGGQYAAAPQQTATTSGTQLPVSLNTIVAGVGAVAALIGIFVLDWYKTDGEGAAVSDISDNVGNFDAGLLRESFFQFGWIISLLAAAFAVAVTVMRKAELKIPAAAAAGVCTLWALVGTFTLKSWSEDNFGSSSSFGIGFWIGVLGLAAATVAVLLPDD